MLRALTFEKSGLTRAEWQTLEKLSTPAKIQGFVNAIPFNFQKTGHMSVRKTLSERKAHCFEGALVAAAALWIGGRRPLLLDLRATKPDFDHVVALFRDPPTGGWGAISKTNHAVLRYREPIYKSIRELTLSYFHEYFLPGGLPAQAGRKTLRSFSRPFDLSRRSLDWLAGDKDLVGLALALDRSPHIPILSPRPARNLRRADPIETEAGEIEEYKK